MMADKRHEYMRLGKGVNLVTATIYECDCGADTEFRDGYWRGRIVCPCCLDEWDYNEEDWPVGFDPDPANCMER